MEDQSQTPREPSFEAAKFAFLGYLPFDEGNSYRGAILVTDLPGKPLEFRCTDPVRPNRLHKIFYGNGLLSHIANELMAAPLLKAVEHKPDVVFAADSVFLSAREKVEYPVIILRRQGEEIRFQETRDQTEPIEEESFGSPSGSFKPIVIRAHWDHPEDREKARPLIRKSFATMDLLEPFDRIKRALEEIERSEREDTKR